MKLLYVNMISDNNENTKSSLVIGGENADPEDMLETMEQLVPLRSDVWRAYRFVDSPFFHVTRT